MEAGVADRKLTRDEQIKLALPSLLEAVRGYFLARPNELSLTYSYDRDGSVVLSYSLAGTMMTRRDEFEAYIKTDYEPEWFARYGHLVISGLNDWPEETSSLSDEELSRQLKKMR